jgi:hypothetical protein
MAAGVPGARRRVERLGAAVRALPVRCCGDRIEPPVLTFRAVAEPFPGDIWRDPSQSFDACRAKTRTFALASG